MHTWTEVAGNGWSAPLLGRHLERVHYCLASSTLLVSARCHTSLHHSALFLLCSRHPP